MIVTARDLFTLADALLALTEGKCDEFDSVYQHKVAIELERVYLKMLKEYAGE